MRYLLTVSETVVSVECEFYNGGAMPLIKGFYA